MWAYPSTTSMAVFIVWGVIIWGAKMDQMGARPTGTPPQQCRLAPCGTAWRRSSSGWSWTSAAGRRGTAPPRPPACGSRRRTPRVQLEAAPPVTDPGSWSANTGRRQSGGLRKRETTDYFAPQAEAEKNQKKQFFHIFVIKGLKKMFCSFSTRNLCTFLNEKKIENVKKLKTGKNRVETLGKQFSRGQVDK